MQSHFARWQRARLRNRHKSDCVSFFFFFFLIKKSDTKQFPAPFILKSSNHNRPERVSHSSVYSRGHVRKFTWIIRNWPHLLPSLLLFLFHSLWITEGSFSVQHTLSSSISPWRSVANWTRRRDIPPSPFSQSDGWKGGSRSCSFSLDVGKIRGLFLPLHLS